MFRIVMYCSHVGPSGVMVYKSMYNVLFERLLLSSWMSAKIPTCLGIFIWFLQLFNFCLYQFFDRSAFWPVLYTDQWISTTNALV